MPRREFACARSRRRARRRGSWSAFTRIETSVPVYSLIQGVTSYDQGRLGVHWRLAPRNGYRGDCRWQFERRYSPRRRRGQLFSGGSGTRLHWRRHYRRPARFSDVRAARHPTRFHKYWHRPLTIRMDDCAAGTSQRFSDAWRGSRHAMSASLIRGMGGAKVRAVQTTGQRSGRR